MFGMSWQRAHSNFAMRPRASRGAFDRPLVALPAAADRFDGAPTFDFAPGFDPAPAFDFAPAFDPTPRPSFDASNAFDAGDRDSHPTAMIASTATNSLTHAITPRSPPLGRGLDTRPVVTRPVATRPVVTRPVVTRPVRRATAGRQRCALTSSELCARSSLRSAARTCPCSPRVCGTPSTSRAESCRS